MDDKKFDTILDINDPDFAQKFVDALGIQPGDTVNIRTPQFDREDGVKPTLLIDDWAGLWHQPASTLKTLGCRAWDEPDDNGQCLMLFPAEWYALIPNGFEIETITGETVQFQYGETDDDRRFGVLAYGVRVHDDLHSQPENAHTVRGNENEGIG